MRLLMLTTHVEERDGSRLTFRQGQHYDFSQLEELGQHLLNAGKASGQDAVAPAAPAPAAPYVEAPAALQPAAVPHEPAAEDPPAPAAGVQEHEG